MCVWTGNKNIDSGTCIGNSQHNRRQIVTAKLINLEFFLFISFNIDLILFITFTAEFCYNYIPNKVNGYYLN